MRWNPVKRNFEEQWKALEAKRKEDDPETPVISKALPIMKWAESFRDQLHRCIGVRYCPLAFVIRPEVVVPAACPDLAPQEPYSEEHGSIEMDLVMRASHGHGLFRDDNAEVYYKLEEATLMKVYCFN